MRFSFGLFFFAFVAVFGVSEENKKAEKTPHKSDKATDPVTLVPKKTPQKVALELPNAFFGALTSKDNLDISRGCMRGVAFHTIVNDHEYFRMVDPMSNGYFYGTLLSFAKNYCQGVVQKSKDSFYSVLLKAPTGKKDSLLHLPNHQNPPDYLVNNYSILFSLGMIESDGAFNSGRDASAWNIDEYSAETATYQSSYDTHKNDKGEITYVPQNVYDDLMKKYQNGNKMPDCMNGVFEVGQYLLKSTESWGWGEGYDFQEALKKCPALAADYQAYLLRITAYVNGPVINRHAQPKKDCDKVLNSIKKILNDKTCAELDPFIANFKDYPDSKFKFKASASGYEDLVRGKNAWVPAKSVEQGRELNPDWSYSPLYLKEYTAKEKYKDTDGVEKYRDIKKPIPQYSELLWINNTIRYYKEKIDLTANAELKKELNAKIEELKARSQQYTSSKSVIQAALEKNTDSMLIAKLSIDKAEALAQAADVGVFSLQDIINEENMKKPANEKVLSDLNAQLSLQTKKRDAQQRAYNTLLKMRKDLESSRVKLEDLLKKSTN